jgi:hypothetical protein
LEGWEIGKAENGGRKTEKGTRGLDKNKRGAVSRTAGQPAVKNSGKTPTKGKVGSDTKKAGTKNTKNSPGRSAARTDKPVKKK